MAVVVRTSLPLARRRNRWYGSHLARADKPHRAAA